jgi:Flp pilus assembly protein CpaB
MLKSNMSEGKWVAESDLMPIGTEPLYTKLKEGERMFTLKVDNVTGTSGFILPGSKVDVVSTLQKGNGEVTGPYSKTILQDVEVLAVDQQPQLPDGTVSKLADRVTLRVALEQAEKLSVFAETGKIRLIVRRPDDTRLVETVGASTIEKARGNQRGGVDGGEGSASRSNPLSILPKFLDPFGRDEKKQDGGAEPPKSAPNPLNPLIPLDPNPAPPVVHAPKIHQMRIINGTRSEVVEFSMSEEQDKRRSRDRGGKQQPKGDAAQERPLLDL